MERLVDFANLLNRVGPDAPEVEEFLASETNPELRKLMELSRDLKRAFQNKGRME